MTEAALPPFYRALLISFFILSPLTFIVLLRITAPYGRHNKSGWGPTVPSTLAWILMELPAALVLPLCYVFGERQGHPVALVFVGLWQLHYIHRAVLFPLRRRGGARRMPIVIMASGMLFNLINGYLNGHYLFTLAPDGPLYQATEWLTDPRFLAGAPIFLAGFLGNLHSDQILFNLRRPGETGYRIPRGGLYRFVSCPNYFSEIVEWCGWALCTWSWAGLGFAVWTAANLVPRALSHHRWYRGEFPDYPRERKAVLPGLL
jgi:3-oxo-5-alpha-steroid 4-dehydrogenase 1